MANVTMRDIAEKLGISIVSVSKALTGKAGVSEELREKIKKAYDSDIVITLDELPDLKEYPIK